MTDLSQDDKKLILEALATISPSGGGSPPHFLWRKLTADWKIETDYDNVRHYTIRACKELLDHLNGD